MASYETIKADTRDGYLELTLNRPALLNPLDEQSATELCHALEQIDLVGVQWLVWDPLQLQAGLYEGLGMLHPGLVADLAALEDHGRTQPDESLRHHAVWS